MKATKTRCTKNEHEMLLKLTPKGHWSLLVRRKKGKCSFHILFVNQYLAKLFEDGACPLCTTD